MSNKRQKRTEKPLTSGRKERKKSINKYWYTDTCTLLICNSIRNVRRKLGMTYTSLYAIFFFGASICVCILIVNVCWYDSDSAIQFQYVPLYNFNEKNNTQILRYYYFSLFFSYYYCSFLVLLFSFDCCFYLFLSFYFFVHFNSCFWNNGNRNTFDHLHRPRKKNNEKIAKKHNTHIRGIGQKKN